MKDQATTLRQMSTPENAIVPGVIMQEPIVRELGFTSHARTIAITGGKGGVGKSNVAVNVALELAFAGYRVSLLDADLALANADLLMGLNPQYHMGHVLSGQRTLAEVIIETGSGV